MRLRARFVNASSMLLTADANYERNERILCDEFFAFGGLSNILKDGYEF